MQSEDIEQLNEMARLIAESTRYNFGAMCAHLKINSAKEFACAVDEAQEDRQPLGDGSESLAQRSVAVFSLAAAKKRADKALHLLSQGRTADAISAAMIGQSMILQAAGSCLGIELKENADRPKRLQDKRHAKDRRIKKEVTKHWATTNKWISANAAARDYCAKGGLAHGYKERTVAQWIRDCAKEKKIKWRKVSVSA